MTKPKQRTWLSRRTCTVSPSILCEMPKSIILRAPLTKTKFAGLRSVWMISRSCTTLTHSSICKQKRGVCTAQDEVERGGEREERGEEEGVNELGARSSR